MLLVNQSGWINCREAVLADADAKVKVSAKVREIARAMARAEVKTKLM